MLAIHSYIKIQGVNRWVKKYNIKECQWNFHSVPCAYMNHDAVSGYSTVYYFSSLPAQKEDHSFNEELFSALFSSSWTMHILVLYSKAALMTGSLSSSQDSLWHSSPQYLHTSQTSVNSRLQHLLNQGLLPTFYQWQAKVQREERGKKLLIWLWFSSEIDTISYVQILIPTVDTPFLQVITNLRVKFKPLNTRKGRSSGGR